MVGLHGQFDYSCQFQEGINVVYGRNGSGKTTLLHVLANVLNGDYLRFAALDFAHMEVRFSDGQSVKIELDKEPYQDHYHGFIKVDGERIHEKQFCPRNPQTIYHEFQSGAEDESILFGEIHDFEPPLDALTTSLPKFALSAAYFPAFRTAIDAWAIHGANNGVRHSHRLRRQQQQKTTFARNLFGQFMPSLDYPATSEIENELNTQIRSAIANVSQADRTFFGDVPSKILEMLAQGKELDEEIPDLLENIEQLSERYQLYPLQVESMWDKLSESVQAASTDNDNQNVTKTVLNAYYEALDKIVDVQEESFAAVEKYLSSVNMFLEGKNITIRALNTNGNGRIANQHNPAVVIQHNGENSPMMRMSQALSSGERQIATLLYAATRLHKQDVILIDEPEISLNVDWQRKLLPEMEKQMPAKQLIVCTHSPIIGAKYREHMIELSPATTQNLSSYDLDIDMFDEIEYA